MNRSRVSVVFLTLALVLAGGAMAAEKMLPGGASGPNLAAFRNDLSQNRQSLAKVDEIVARMEKQKLVTAADSDEIDQHLMAYATAIKNAYDQASKLAETAGNTNGKEGSTEHFLAFEQTAREDQAKVDKIKSRLEAIHNKVEAKEFKLEGKSTSSLDSSAVSAMLASAGCFYDSVAASLQGEWQLVGSAEASLAIPCVSPCAAKNWPACRQCIVSKAPAALNAWNQFQNCWNAAHAPFQAWKRAACVAVFLYRIA